MNLNELQRLRRIDVSNEGYSLTKWRISWGAYAEKGRHLMLVAHVGDEVVATVRAEVDQATDEVYRSTGVMFTSLQTGEEV